MATSAIAEGNIEMSSAIRQFCARVKKAGVRRKTDVKTVAMGRERIVRAWDIGDDTFIFEDKVLEHLTERPSVLVVPKSCLTSRRKGWVMTVTTGNHSVAAFPLLDGRFWKLSHLPMAKRGDVLTGETTYNVTVPGGATVTINGISVTSGGTVNPAPAFAAGGEAATTKFERGAGDTWAITAFAELDNDAIGADVPDDAITVYRGDTMDGVTNAVVPTITGKKSAVKVEMTVDAPTDAPQQFFRVGFGD